MDPLLPARVPVSSEYEKQEYPSPDQSAGLQERPSSRTVMKGLSIWFQLLCFFGLFSLIWHLPGYLFGIDIPNFLAEQYQIRQLSAAERVLVNHPLIGTLSSPSQS